LLTILKNHLMTELDIFKLENFLELLGVRNMVEFRVKLLAHISTGLPNFEMEYEFSFQSGTTLKIWLHFFLHSSGRYYLLKYIAELQYEGDRTKNERQTFYMNEMRITFREGFNLLQGRYVEKMLTSKVNGAKTLYWVKINFHDKDKYGVYLYLRFRSAPDYCLEKVLDLYPNILELSESSSRAAIIEGLKQGNREKVTIISHCGPGISKLIEANPKMGTLRIETSPREVRRRNRIPIKSSGTAKKVAGPLTSTRQRHIPMKIAI